MKHYAPLIAALLLGSAAQAAPYCEMLLDSDALPKKYAKIAPVYSDDGSGWIFTQDQLKDRYDMKPTSKQLVQAIVDEFKMRGVPLAIVIAPPRPVVAGQQQLNAAMGANTYDVTAAQASFDALIKGLSMSGAIVPNLSDVALADASIKDDFYFRRDTHWTTTGSAVSAIALAKAVNGEAPDLFANDGRFDMDDLAANDTIDERGSLADIVRDTCGASLPAETAESFNLTRNGSLLDTVDREPSIALLGSSFSNRYKRDYYRFADALSRAFDEDVENFSVSGGGPIGAIEAYVASGALERQEHKLVIWELPYTESFNSSSFLRQLLGMLRSGSNVSKATVLENSSATSLVQLDDGASIAGIEIVPAELAKQSFSLEVRFDNGSKSKIYLGRRASVPVQMRSPSLFSDLSFIGNRKPIEISITPLKGASIDYVAVFESAK